MSTLFDVIDGLPISIAVNSLSDRSQIVFINKQFTHNFGYELQDISTTERWSERAYPDPTYRTKVFKIWDAAVDRAMAVKGHVESMEFQVCAKDQTLRDVVFSANVLNDLLIVSLTDVTQRRAVERELASARAQLERTAFELTENIPIGTYTMVQPADGGMARFSFLSSRFLQLTGLNREEALADPMKAFACVHPDDFEDWVQLNIDVFEQKKRFYGETRLIRNGEIRWISAESVPRPLPDGTTVWEGVLIDITELRESQQAILEAKRRAEHQEQLKSEFLATMSHEIRTPLTAIVGLTQLLSREDSPQRQEKIVSGLKNASDTLLRIVDDALDYARIEAGELSIQPAPFCVNELLEHTEALHGWTARQKGLELKIKPCHRQHQTLYGDVVRIEQILNNLVSNAIKFTDHGEVVISVNLTDVDHETQAMRLEVRDTGVGIPQAELSRLFLPFQQIETGQKTRPNGSGLGLPISNRLAELMGGQFAVESVPGYGSRFSVELPLKISGALTLPQPGVLGQKHLAARGAEQHIRLLGIKVLVVDDSPTILAVLEQMLQSEGAECVLAGSAAEAIQSLQDNGPKIDVLLMDMQMPSIDGLAAIRVIRDELGLGGLPILAMTAGILQEQRHRALTAGANDLLHKPITIESLVNHILRWTHPETSAKTARSESPKINLQHAMKTLNGDQAMFSRLLDAFILEHTPTVRLTRDEVAAGQHESAARRMHRLRGGAGQMGALDLQHAAHRVEMAIRTGAEPIAPCLDTLESEYSALLAAAQALRRSAPSPGDQASQ